MFLEPEPPAFSVQPHVIVVRDHRAAGITRGVALCTASEGIREVAGPVFVVRMHAHTISRLSKRPSVQTRMAVGQVSIFRSVAIALGDASKIATSLRAIGIRTFGRFESRNLVRQRVLTRILSREIGPPGLLKSGTPVPFGIRKARDVGQS